MDLRHDNFKLRTLKRIFLVIISTVNRSFVYFMSNDLIITHDYGKVTEYRWAFEIRFGLVVCCIYCLMKILRSR